ncbi:MAG TPA: ribosome small subunit-dependent GTPase A [Bacillota bacterium]|nr:ribosome small subunit-dependent GTPase A [Bacillota bacterium]
MKKGRIVKAISGFYYVETDGIVYPCKGRGVFRKQNRSPLVGDFVSFEIDENEEGYIKDIEERTNTLQRPPIANIDQALVVMSAKEPSFSPLLLDRFLVFLESKHIQPLIYITKVDQLDKDMHQEIKQWKEKYERIGYDVLLLSIFEMNEETIEYIYSHFENKVSVITGQSGVGKSSLLNAIDESLSIKTDAISKSLGRGKHTTRHVELLTIGDGLVADTPGFSVVNFDDIEAEELSNAFPEMRIRAHQCKFRGCLHMNEPQCAVKQAVEIKDIEETRYKHYVAFMKEIQDRKPRY